VSTIWTFPGKIGDCFLQWPVARRWADQNLAQFGVAVSEALRPIVPLLECQPGVTGVQVWPGITNFSCGGQPWDFGVRVAEGYGQVFHAGFRKMPTYMITQFVRDQLGFTISSAELGAQSLFVGERYTHRMLVIHGTLRTHRNDLPRIWPMVRAIEAELHDLFPQGVFVVGTPEELDYSEKWIEGRLFNDQANWLKLAQFLNRASVVIGAGSSVAALAGSLGIPCVRVHDDVNGLPAHVWSHPGPDQLNLTEFKPEKLLKFVEGIHARKPWRNGGQAGDRQPEDLASAGLGPQRGGDDAGGVRPA
jgi:hypothetical protein